jgi:hypothetical protein
LYVKVTVADDAVLELMLSDVGLTVCAGIERSVAGCPEV